MVVGLNLFGILFLMLFYSLFHVGLFGGLNLVCECRFEFWFPRSCDFVRLVFELRLDFGAAFLFEFGFGFGFEL